MAFTKPSALAGLLAALCLSHLTAPSLGQQQLSPQVPTAPEADDHIPAPLPATQTDSAPGCPPWTFADSSLGFPLEHTDEVCDRALQNDPDRVERLRLELERSVVTGELRRLKDEKTWVCPSDNVAAVVGGEGETPTGPRSVWLFRNEASTPVSVGWINPHANNAEVSAFDNEISPPHRDPRAILRPGEWASLDVFLGHTFQIRELRAVGGGGDLAPGRVLLRHRAGPIPIRNKFGGAKACPVQALVDPDPQTELPNDRARDLEAELARIEENRRKFRRTDFHYNHRCNSLHRVFTNRVGCPVDVYYGGVNPDGHVASKDGVDGRSHSPPASGNSTEGEEAAKASPNLSNSCFERFKFHLGINPSLTPDYVEKWDSPVAFEATYLTHKFVARLRHDPSVVVDEVVIDRTVVRDCPEGKKTEGTGDAKVKEAVGARVGRAEVDANGEADVEVGETFDAVGEAASKVLGTNFTSDANVGARVNSSSPVVVVVVGNATATSADGGAEAARLAAAKDS